MSKFNKFLNINEVLITVIRHRQNNRRLQATVFLGLPMVFFFMYPLISFGRQGLGFWFFLIGILLAITLSTIYSQQAVYLLTDERLISLRSYAGRDYRLQGKVLLENITMIKRQGKNNILLKVKGKKVYLTNIENRDVVLAKLVKIRKQDSF